MTKRKAISKKIRFEVFTRNWRSWQDDMHALIQELEG